jgi:hypothetical protein
VAGQSISYVVNPSDSVTDLKQAMTSRGQAGHLVFFGVKLVEDGKTLQQHGVKDKSVIHQVHQVIGGGGGASGGYCSSGEEEVRMTCLDLRAGCASSSVSQVLL